MQFSNKTEYALHIIIFLAINREKAYTIEELADSLKVSKNYAAKVLRTLNAAGIIRGKPGPGGGYRLGKKPKNITFKEVVALFDPPEEAFHCLYKARDCGYYPNCGILTHMGKGIELFYNYLDKVTLSSVLKNVDPNGPFEKWLTPP